MTTVKNSIYFPIKAELSFKNQLILLGLNCRGKAFLTPPSQELLPPRVIHAKQVLHRLLWAAQPQLVPSCHHREHSRRNKQGRSDTAWVEVHWLHPAGSEHLGWLCMHWEWAEQGAPGHQPEPGAGSSCSLRQFMQAESRTGNGCHSLCAAWQQCQQAHCTAWPRCWHRVNPERLVHCCRDLVIPGKSWGQQSWGQLQGGLQPLPAPSIGLGVAPGGSTVAVQ